MSGSAPQAGAAGGRAHWLQHAPFEGLGSIEPWLDQAGFDVTVTRLFEDAMLPEPEGIDFLVVMGGPMSVNDEHVHPWLVPEKRFIADVIRRGKPVLGICLGAQLIAGALGARVFPNREREIGWWPVRAVPSADRTCLRFPDELEVFHWHGETFDLPPGAVRLAESEACRNQAFRIGEAVLGLQFHLETTPEGARAMVKNCRSDLTPGAYVRSEREIMEGTAACHRAANGLLERLLDSLSARRQ